MLVINKTFRMLILSVMIFGCDKADKTVKENKEPVLSEYYDVIDSDLISGGDSINWMDNERIILRAIDPKKPSRGKIYIWNSKGRKGRIQDVEVNSFLDSYPDLY